MGELCDNETFPFNRLLECEIMTLLGCTFCLVEYLDTLLVSLVVVRTFVSLLCWDFVSFSFNETGPCGFGISSNRLSIFQQSYLFSIHHSEAQLIDLQPQFVKKNILLHILIGTYRFVPALFSKDNWLVYIIFGPSYS